MQLRELRQEDPRLGHLTWWDTLATPGIMQLRNGALMAVLRFAGPDLHSAQDSALIAQAGRLNALLRRLDGGWGLTTEARRHEVQDYPASAWPDPVSAAVEARRRQILTRPGQHYVTTQYLSLVYRPTGVVIPDWKRLLYDNLPPAAGVEEPLERFDEAIARTQGLLHDCCPVVERLEGSDYLTYLHSTVSFKAQRIAVPQQTCFLDTYLTDTDLHRRWQPPSLLRWPQLGAQWLRCISVKAYPAETHPGILATLETLPLEYRACLRYIVLERAKAISELRKYRKAHYGQRVSAGAAFVEKTTGKATELLEETAMDLAEEANLAQQDVQHNRVSYGYLTQTIVVWDTDFAQAKAKAEMVEEALNQAEFTAKIETVNTMAAWQGTLPGDMVSNVRRPPLHSHNLAHLMPATSTERGRAWNPHVGAPALLLATGRGHTPFWLNHHVGDVGHFQVVGPVGMGKSTLLALMALQWRRYTGGQVFAFDKGCSLKCATYAVGGQWYDVGAELATQFHAGAHLDDADFMPWRLAWEPQPGPWQCFEMESLLRTPELAAQIFRGLYYHLLPQLTGVPTLLLLDEGYLYLRYVPWFVQDALKDLRKKETSVGFFAQSIGDYARSPIAHDINEQCLTRIWLSNYRALEPETGALYGGLGLHERHREIIAHLVPKKEYYYQGYGEQGNQVFDLQLDPFQLAFVGKSRPAELARMTELYADDPQGFPIAWLHELGLHQDADALKSQGDWQP